MGILKNSWQLAVGSWQFNNSRRQWLWQAAQLAAYATVARGASLAPSPHSLSPAMQSPDAWPQFRGSYNLTGVSPSTINANLKQMWSLNANEIIESSAAIADATVYVGTGSNSNAGELIAADLWSGKLKWKYKTKEAVGDSSPAIANGLVFVGDLEGTFHAVNAANGQGLWTYKTGGEIKCSPVIVGDRVLIGSYDGSLYCFEARTGKTIWAFKTENYVHGTPCIIDGIAYFGGCDEIFHGIRISDGKEVTRLPGIGNTGASVTILNTPAGLQAFFGNFANEVLSINLKTRRRVWRYLHPQRQFPFYSSTAVIDGKVILGGRDKVVHCLNAANGKELWSFRTNARVESSPAVAGSRVYIGSNDGRFYVLDLNTGAKVWEFNAGAAVSASPAIAGGRVVIGAQDGKLYCFG
jgi:eukaryotic-like serine/threonine-protein kinase